LNKGYTEIFKEIKKLRSKTPKNAMKIQYLKSSESSGTPPKYKHIGES